MTRPFLMIRIDWEPLELPYRMNEHKFWKFHRANPHVYQKYCEYAAMVLGADKTKFATNCIMERMRWEVTMGTISEDDYAIGNNHRPYYARLWLRDHPEHPNFFTIRPLTNPIISFPNTGLIQFEVRRGRKPH